MMESREEGKMVGLVPGKRKIKSNKTPNNKTQSPALFSVFLPIIPLSLTTTSCCCVGAFIFPFCGRGTCSSERLSDLLMITWFMGRAGIQTLAAQLSAPVFHHHTALERGRAPVGKKSAKLPGKELPIAVTQPCL